MIFSPTNNDTIEEIAFAKFQERKRLLLIINSILKDFPNHCTSRKRHKIAIQLCNKLYEEVTNQFGLL